MLLDSLRELFAYQSLVLCQSQYFGPLHFSSGTKLFIFCVQIDLMEVYDCVLDWDCFPYSISGLGSEQFLAGVLGFLCFAV